MMKKLLIFSCALPAAFLVCVVMWKQSFPYVIYFDFPMTEGTVLEHSGTVRSGFDLSTMFLFRCKDDSFLSLLKKNWRLPKGDYGKGQFGYTRGDFPWWPSKDELKTINGPYFQIDHQHEEYRTAWFDPNGKILYVICGSW